MAGLAGPDSHVHLTPSVPGVFVDLYRHPQYYMRPAPPAMKFVTPWESLPRPAALVSYVASYLIHRSDPDLR